MLERKNKTPIHRPGVLFYQRSAIEKESPEQYGYDKIKYNLSESSVTDLKLEDLSWDEKDLDLCYGDHLGYPELRKHIARQASGISRQSKPGWRPANSWSGSNPAWDVSVSQGSKRVYPLIWTGSMPCSLINTRPLLVPATGLKWTGDI